MIVKIRVLIVAISLIALYSCTKEEYLNEQDFFVENNASISINGEYNGVRYNDNYKLKFSQSYAIYRFSYQFDENSSVVDSVKYTSVILYSEDRINSLELNMFYDDTICKVRYVFNGINTNKNKLESFSFANYYPSPGLGFYYANSDVKLDEVTDFSYDLQTGVIRLNLSSVFEGDNIDCVLSGQIALKVYSRENYVYEENN